MVEKTPIEWTDGIVGLCPWCQSKKMIRGVYLGWTPTKSITLCKPCYEKVEQQMPHPTFIVVVEARSNSNGTENTH